MDKIFKSILEEAKKVCKDNKVEVPIIRRDNRIKTSGYYTNYNKTIRLKIKGIEDDRHIFHAMYHELGHFIYNINLVNGEIDREYIAEKFCYECILKYRPQDTDWYINMLGKWLKYLKLRYPSHYEAFSRLYTEIVSNKYIHLTNQ